MYPKVKFPGFKAGVRSHEKVSRKSSDLSNADSLDYQSFPHLLRERAGSVVSVGSEYSATSVVASEEGHDGIASPLSPSSDKPSSTDSCESAIMTECFDVVEKKLFDESEKEAGDEPDGEDDTDETDEVHSSEVDQEDKENVSLASSKDSPDTKAAVIDQTSLEETVLKNRTGSDMPATSVRSPVEGPSKAKPSSARHLSSDTSGLDELHLGGDCDQQRLAEDTAMYVYQVHKRKQATRNSWSSNSSNSQPGSPTSPNSAFLQQGKTGKPFNPFPVRLRNQNRAQNGVKLGLYTQQTLEELESKVSGSRKHMSSTAQGKSRTNVFGLR